MSCVVSAALLNTAPALLLSVLLVNTAEAQHGTNTPTPEYLIRCYSEALRPLRRASFVAHVTQIHQGPTMPNGTVLEKGVYRVLHDSGRWWVEAATTNSAVIDGKMYSERTLLEFSCDGQRTRTVYLDPRTRSVQSVHARLTDDSMLTKGLLVNGYAFSPFVSGALPMNGTLSTVQVLKAQNTQTLQKLADGPKLMFELTTSGDWGKLNIRFDASRSCLPRQVEQRKLVGIDWIRDKTPKPPFTGDGNWFPRAALVEHVLRLDVTKIDRMAGKDVITGWEQTETYVFKRAPSVGIGTTVQLQEVNLAPDVSQRAFAIRTTIRNGTPVIVEDDETIAYEWRDGSVVKSVDREGLANLKVPPFRSPPYSRIWVTALIMAGLALALFILGSRLARKTFRSRARG